MRRLSIFSQKGAGFGLFLATTLVAFAAGCGGSRRARAPLPPTPIPAPAPNEPEPSPRPPAPATAETPDPAPRKPQQPQPARLPLPTAHGWSERTYVTAAGQTLQYLLFQPADVHPGRTYPLVLFLHSSSASGVDQISQYEANRGPGLELWASDPVQRRHPSYIVAPRADFSVAPTWVRQWVATPDPSPQEREPLELAIELIRNELPAELPIDPRRLYITGYSMGAFGVWIGIGRHPELFAAAIPIAGGGDPVQAAAASAAVWAFHGDADPVVPVDRTREMVEAVRQGGGNVRYNELPGVDHGAYGAALTTPGLVDWLFEQARDEPGRLGRR